MTIKALPIFDSLKKLLLMMVILGAIFVLTASFAFAFHPGQDKNGTVPQGPHQTACGNEGLQGINKAIANGGMVPL